MSDMTPVNPEAPKQTAAETYAELEEVENPAGGYQWKPTGRDVVIIKLTGHWRDK